MSSKNSRHSPTRSKLWPGYRSCDSLFTPDAYATNGAKTVRTINRQE